MRALVPWNRRLLDYDCEDGDDGDDGDGGDGGDDDGHCTWWRGVDWEVVALLDIPEKIIELPSMSDLISIDHFYQFGLVIHAHFLMFGVYRTFGGLDNRGSTPKVQNAKTSIKTKTECPKTSLNREYPKP